MNKTNKKRKVGQKKPRPQKPSPMLPILHRPGAEMSFSLYIIGWAFRSIVLFCGIFGLTLFIGDASSSAKTVSEADDAMPAP